MALAAAPPEVRPANPCFSSGPCAKRPGYRIAALEGALLGRSHRAKAPKARLLEVIEHSRKLLRMPESWKLGIMPGSDTGAVEAALWSLLGARGVDVLAFESFSAGWASDVIKQLRLSEARVLEAPYGRLPDLAEIDFSHDVVLAWNGTTSGVRIPDGAWIPERRPGLVIADATSAAFAMDLPWPKLDVVTWSWQKVLGGEAGHGMLALSPRAVQRLGEYTPAWPLPKVFRLTKGGKLIAGIFNGETINTPSMLAVEDALDGLRWAEGIGGLPALIARTEGNFAAVSEWVARTPWVEFLAERPEWRSPTSICLRIALSHCPPEAQAEVAKRIAGLLEAEAVAYDIGAYREAPSGLRIWGGATVETADIRALLPWLDWAFSSLAREVQPARATG